MQLTGEKVTGVEAIKIWAYFALTTPRYRYRAFSWDYGSDMEELIGESYSEELKRAEIERYVKECLLVQPYISDVIINNIEFNGVKVLISLTLETDFGDTELEAEVEE